MPEVRNAKNLNRDELLRRIKKHVPPGMTTRDVGEATKLIVDEISETLAQGGRVELRGFGTFELRVRNPRRARNPRTGSGVFIGLRRIAHFRPGVSLRERLRTPPSDPRPDA